MLSLEGSGPGGCRATTSAPMWVQCIIRCCEPQGPRAALLVPPSDSWHLPEADTGHVSSLCSPVPQPPLLGRMASRLCIHPEMKFRNAVSGMRIAGTLRKPTAQLGLLPSFGLSLLRFGHSVLMLVTVIIQYVLEGPSNQLFYLHLKFLKILAEKVMKWLCNQCQTYKGFTSFERKCSLI